VSAVAESWTVPPNAWCRVGGLWVHITPLDDPLLYAHLHRVTVDWRDGLIRAQVVGNCAAAEWRTDDPDTLDFAQMDGSPL
jgi:hypothetical protein